MKNPRDARTELTHLLFPANLSEVNQYFSLFYLVLVSMQTQMPHSHIENQRYLVCPPVDASPELKLSEQLSRLYLLAVSTATGPLEFHRITTNVSISLYTSTLTGKVDECK